mmetsp:Transcript_12411/g.31507  ORF Transcript_12411/g.31507 Transcript_12411/m.31507 type:complete len:606 (-) Transcript_12411:222-2039(-)
MYTKMRSMVLALALALPFRLAVGAVTPVLAFRYVCLVAILSYVWGCLECHTKKCSSSVDRSSSVKSAASLIHERSETECSSEYDSEPDIKQLVQSMRAKIKKAQLSGHNHSKRTATSASEQKSKLKRAETYFQWFEAACEMEEPVVRKKWCGWKQQDWKQYDKVLLRDRLQALKEASQSNDIHFLKETLRGDLIRNLGHVASPEVFEKKLLPPKTIKKYIKEVVKDLRQVIMHTGSDFSLREKIKYITEVYYSYGSTALLLSGGGSLGAFHMGVLRALIDQNCLPHIIAGSSGGSVIAAIAGSKTYEELKTFLEMKNLKKMQMWFKFSTFLEIVNHYTHHGHLQDAAYFQQWLKDLFGDLTFLEAREKSGKVLNIVVSPAHTNEPHRVLNYINAPNVLIWSAVSASCAFPLLFPAQDLLVKMNGKAKSNFATLKRTKSGRWHDGSFGDDLPMQKLKEYFHVNYSIVSQTNVHAAPWLTVKRHIPTWLAFLFESEFKHRFKQLDALLPHISLKNWLRLFHTSWEGDVTVVLPMHPAAGFQSTFKALTRLSPDQCIDLIEQGERATWPKIQSIKCMTAIEDEIGRSLHKVRTMVSKEPGSEMWQPLN